MGSSMSAGKLLIAFVGVDSLWPCWSICIEVLVSSLSTQACIILSVMNQCISSSESWPEALMVDVPETINMSAYFNAMIRSLGLLIGQGRAAHRDHPRCSLEALATV